MSNYTKTTNFTAKDALPTGDPNKRAYGAEVDAEFDAIQVAVATKEDSANKGVAGGYVPLSGSTLIATTYLPAATTTTIGASELATLAEATTGTDTTRVVTPASALGTLLGGFPATLGAVTATSLAGPLTGNVTGDTAGTHTGAVVGDVTGDLSGDVNTGLHQLSDAVGLRIDSGGSVILNSSVAFVGSTSFLITSATSMSGGLVLSGDNASADTFPLTLQDSSGNVTRARFALPTGSDNVELRDEADNVVLEVDNDGASGAVDFKVEPTLNGGPMTMGGQTLTYWRDVATLSSTGSSTLGETLLIPSGCSIIEVVFDGISTSTASAKVQVEIGGGGGSYAVSSDGSIAFQGGGSSDDAQTWISGGPADAIRMDVASYTYSGITRLVKMEGTNRWGVSSTVASDGSTTWVHNSAGKIDSAGTVVDRLRVVVTAGTFDAGSAYIRAYA